MPASCPTECNPHAAVFHIGPNTPQELRHRSHICRAEVCRSALSRCHMGVYYLASWRLCPAEHNSSAYPRTTSNLHKSCAGGPPYFHPEGTISSGLNNGVEYRWPVHTYNHCRISAPETHPADDRQSYESLRKCTWIDLSCARPVQANLLYILIKRSIPAPSHASLSSLRINALCYRLFFAIPQHTRLHLWFVMKEGVPTQLLQQQPSCQSLSAVGSWRPQHECSGQTLSKEFLEVSD